MGGAWCLTIWYDISLNSFSSNIIFWYLSGVGKCLGEIKNKIIVVYLNLWRTHGVKILTFGTYPGWVGGWGKSRIKLNMVS